MTHAELVDLAAKWLRQRGYPVVATEVVTGASETPDAIAFGHGYHASAVVECKATRADFLADRNKFFRQFPTQGMGAERYMLGSPDVFADDEVYPGWGILRPGPRGGVGMTREAQRQPEWSLLNENGVLVSLLRRIGGIGKAAMRENHVSIRCYTTQTKCSATLHLEAADD